MSTALSNIIGSENIGATTSFLQDLRSGVTPELKTIAPLGVGAAAGVFMSRRIMGMGGTKGRVLGGVTGGVIGANIPALLEEHSRRDALCNIGQVGTGVVGARVMRGSPVIGFLLGYLGGGAITHFAGLRG